MTVAIDVLVFLFAWAVAQVVFRGYEAHVGIPKRLMKLAVLLGISIVAHVMAGRAGFYALISALAFGIAVVHGYWFHYRNGIHWRTAEPRDKYLRLIGVLHDEK